MFKAIALGLITLGLWWWWRTDTRLKSLRHAWLWRTPLGMFVLGAIVCPVAIIHWGHDIPGFLVAPGLLWHVLVLPVTAVVILVLNSIALVRRPKRAVNASRRRFLTAMAAAGPPLVVGGLTGVGLEQVGKFRVREIDLPVNGWPDQLNGLTIAVVADVHNGPFATQAMLDEIVVRTNAMRADLVVLAGDLINTTLEELPAALDMATALHSRLGTVAIMGNHDVMAKSTSFAKALDGAGIPLLIEDVLNLEPAPGVKVQLLGVNWEFGDAALYQSVANVAAMRDRSAFPICLAHHPHAWDEAVRQGLPLVIAGHTHGGQIMLTDTIGAGPLKFRYWTGIHRRAGSTMVISNGVGNWFPLRVNAPAELLKLTLRPAPIVAMQPNPRPDTARPLPPATI
jgi:uncharacterized protein